MTRAVRNRPGAAAWEAKAIGEGSSKAPGGGASPGPDHQCFVTPDFDGLPSVVILSASPHPKVDDLFPLEERRNVRHRARHVDLFLPHRGDIVNRAACSLDAFQACNEPGRQILR